MSRAWNDRPSPSVARRLMARCSSRETIRSITSPVPRIYFCTSSSTKWW